MPTTSRARRSAFISAHLAAAVRRRMTREGLSHERLAKMAGVPRSSLSEWLGGQAKKCPPADFLWDIFRAMRMSVNVEMTMAYAAWSDISTKKICRPRTK